MALNTPDTEQHLYARWLDWTTRIGLAALLLAFAAYLSGLLPPHIAPGLLPAYWGLPVEQFLAATQMPSGWSWVHYLHQGDPASLVGICILAGSSTACLGVLVARSLGTGDRLFALLCLAEIAVLVIAASGLLNGAT